MNMYVSNLGFQVQEIDLQKLFSAYGEVTSAKIITDRETGRSRGFGFVEMTSDDEARKAIAELDQAEYVGKTIRVNEARPKTDRPRTGGGFGGNRGGGSRSGFNGGGNRGGNREGGNREGGYNSERKSNNRW